MTFQTTIYSYVAILCGGLYIQQICPLVAFPESSLRESFPTLVLCYPKCQQTVRKKGFILKENVPCTSIYREEIKAFEGDDCS
jgi:hypothetical protein